MRRWRGEEYLKSASYQDWPDLIVDGVSGAEQVGEPEDGHHRERSGGDEERRQTEKRAHEVLASRPGTEIDTFINLPN